MDVPFQMDEEEFPSQPESINDCYQYNGHRHQQLPKPHLRVLDLAQLVLPKHLRQDDDPMTTTTTEDDFRYEEDLDDRLDTELQELLQREYVGRHILRTHTPVTLTPPENFAPVIHDIYRLSFPQPQNFDFLKTLKLKLILCLIPEDYPELQLQFLAENNIELFQLGILGNKEPFVVISADLITAAAKIVLDPTNHPILIHCNRGKHRTGCLVGVIRRLQMWSLSLIFDEYRKFAAPKERHMDQQFIELYNDSLLREHASQQGWLPLLWD